MRVPIYTSGRNPLVDTAALPILRKNPVYVASEVAQKRMKYIDPQRPELGAILSTSTRSVFCDDPHASSLNRVAGSGFSTAWHLKQSGYAGPLVWQLKTSKR